MLLVATTQQKYRSARVAEELAAAAAGAKLVFVQTHADCEDDIRADWHRLLADRHEVGHIFLIDSLAALERRETRPAAARRIRRAGRSAAAAIRRRGGYPHSPGEFFGPAFRNARALPAAARRWHARRGTGAKCHRRRARQALGDSRPADERRIAFEPAAVGESAASANHGPLGTEPVFARACEFIKASARWRSARFCSARERRRKWPSGARSKAFGR